MLPNIFNEVYQIYLNEDLCSNLFSWVKFNIVLCVHLLIKRPTGTIQWNLAIKTIQMTGLKWSL